MKIDVLGTEYFVFRRTKAEDRELEVCDGYCDHTSKTIVVTTKDEECTLADFDVYIKKVLRHEIIHAFLFESGLHVNFKHDEWGHDETMIDWFAVQYPKLTVAFKAADCL
ncbi:hypothetical protein [Anaerotignum sp.]